MVWKYLPFFLFITLRQGGENATKRRACAKICLKQGCRPKGMLFLWDTDESSIMEVPMNGKPNS